MFGVRTTQVFTSRWKALLWAAGVMMTAYCTVPSDDQTADGPPSDATGPSHEELDAQRVLRDLQDIQNR